MLQNKLKISIFLLIFFISILFLSFNFWRKQFAKIILPASKNITCETKENLSEGKVALESKEAQDDCTFIGCSMFDFF